MSSGWIFHAAPFAFLDIIAPGYPGRMFWYGSTDLLVFLCLVAKVVSLLWKVMIDKPVSMVDSVSFLGIQI